MRIDEVLLALVVLIVLFKLCQWFADFVEQEQAESLFWPLTPVGEPSSSNTDEPVLESINEETRHSASKGTQTIVNTLSESSTQTDGDNATDPRTRAIVTKWQSVAWRGRKLALQRVQRKLQREADNLSNRERELDSSNARLASKLKGSDTIRKQLAAAMDQQRKRADAAEYKLRQAEAAMSRQVAMRDVQDNSTQANNDLEERTINVDDAAKARCGQALKDAAAAQSQIEMLQRRLVEVEQERDAERGRADRQQQDAVEYDEKRAKSEKSGEQANVEAETARQTASAAESKMEELQGRLIVAESRANDGQSAKWEAERRAEKLQRELDDARRIHEENQRAAEQQTELIEQLKSQMDAEIERVQQLNIGASGERNQDSSIDRDQAIKERNTAVSERDIAVQQHSKALEELRIVTLDREQAASSMVVAQEKWDQKLAELDEMRKNRDLAVSARDLAVNAFQQAESREQEAKRIANDVYQQAQTVITELREKCLNLQRELEQQVSTPASQTGPSLPQDESMTDEPHDLPSAQEEHGSFNGSGTSHLTDSAGASQPLFFSTQSNPFQPTSTHPQQAESDTVNGAVIQPNSGNSTNPFSFASPQGNTNSFASTHAGQPQNDTLADTLARMQDRSRRFDGVGKANPQVANQHLQLTQNATTGVTQSQPRSDSSNKGQAQMGLVQSNTSQEFNASGRATRFSRPGKPRKSVHGQPARPTALEVINEDTGMQQGAGDAGNSQSRYVSSQATGSQTVSAQNPPVQSGGGQSTKPESAQEGVDPNALKQMQDAFSEEFQKCEKCRKTMLDGVCQRLGCGVPAPKTPVGQGPGDGKTKKIAKPKSQIAKHPEVNLREVKERVCYRCKKPWTDPHGFTGCPFCAPLPDAGVPDEFDESGGEDEKAKGKKQGPGGGGLDEGR